MEDANRAEPMPGRRINVVGASCSGKTTMAAALADVLGLEHVEVDALYHGPDWTPTPFPILRDRVARLTAGDRWVVDGNYSQVRETFWRRADTVVWLDFGIGLVLYRMFHRTRRRVLRKEPLWNDNREDLRSWLFSRDSLLLYTLRTYRSRRREYLALLAGPESAHLVKLHFARPAEAECWLRAVRAARSAAEG